jgi:hypothetical protein
MRILEWNVPRDYELILFGDNQEGNVLQYKKGYLETIQYVLANPNRFALHMGDEMEAFWIDDPRYSPEILTANPLIQQSEVVTDLQPLADSHQLITILYGNHSHKLSPKIGDITEDTCLRKLHIQYGGFSCVVIFRDEQGIQFKGFFTHGRKLIRSIADDPVRRLANEQLQLKQHLKHKMGDCLLMAKGHCHKLLICDPRTQLYLTTEEQIEQKYTHNPPFGKGGYIHPDHRWYAATGSFLRTFGEKVSGYAEQAEMDPVELGYVIVEIHDRNISDVRKVVV